MQSVGGSALRLCLFTLTLLALLPACGGQTTSSTTGGEGSAFFSPAADGKSGVVLSPYPATVGPAWVEVRLVHDDGSPIKGAQVEVEATAAEAGTAPVLARAKESVREIGGEVARQMYGTEFAEEVAYVTQDFRFTAAGDWIITVRAVLPDGQRFTHAFDVQVSPH